MASLFDPIRLGAIDAPNRILMAPLTRGRGTRDHVPTPLMIDYYRQRASAGLIITEATGISRQGLGWPYAPGLWNQAQVAAWAAIVAAVHEAGGRMVAQLWHMGRQVHSSVTGEQPVSSSATATEGKAHTYDGKQPFETARPLEISEIPALLESFAQATRNALAAGFDGVQIHAANGYLIDQFIRDGSNHRTDEYGGTLDGRLRLLDEVTRAVVEVAGAERTAVRLSPNGDTQGVDDSDQNATFTGAAKVLDGFGLAFLELREPGPDGTFGKSDRPAVAPLIARAFRNPLVLNSDYSLDQAQAALADGPADAISFGRAFIANPDLPRRLAEGLPLNADNPRTWYSQGPEGYIDYPTAD